MQNLAELTQHLTNLRTKLEQHFSSETMAPGTNYTTPSAGHCAAVSIIIHFELGAGITSTTINSTSHWYNHIEIDNTTYEIDITGDQFDLPPLQIQKDGFSYSPKKIRQISEANMETLSRALVLAKKSNLRKAITQITTQINQREENA